MIVCGHRTGKAVRFVNVTGNFVGFLVEQAFASIFERNEGAAVVIATHKGDRAPHECCGSHRLRR